MNRHIKHRSEDFGDDVEVGVDCLVLEVKTDPIWVFSNCALEHLGGANHCNKYLDIIFTKNNPHLWHCEVKFFVEPDVD